MATKIKIKMLNHSISVPVVIDKGDWIDLRAAKDIELQGPTCVNARKIQDRKAIFKDELIPLGVAIEMPPGYEAIVVTRSGTYKAFGVVLCNGEGIIDNPYKGDNDQWFAHVIPFRDCVISEGDRICQFRIQLSQKATAWQKIKWLFSSGIKLEIVESLGNPDRGGHGKTGIK